MNNKSILPLLVLFVAIINCSTNYCEAWEQQNPSFLIDENGVGHIPIDASDLGDFEVGYKLVKKYKLRKRTEILESAAPNIRRELSRDVQRPLNASDFARAKFLGVEDFQPMFNLSKYLNDPLFYEGDIAEGVVGRNAIRNRLQRWPNGRIPYVVSGHYNEHQRSVIARALMDYHEKTCIRFVPKTASDYNYIYIYPSSGCASQVGVAGGMQMVSIGPGCEYVGIVEHELMHATGFWHEQSRADRDEYIRINWANIQSGMEYNFDKYSLQDIQHLDELYDYSSVMHYGAYAFAKGNQPTISPLRYGAQIGQRYALSRTDLVKINKLYDCRQFLNQGSNKLG